MTLRRQGSGGQKIWELGEIKSGFEKYFSLNGKYPTAQEIDSFEFLPSSRSIQRTFGGLIALRKRLNLSGQTDFTKGEHATNRAYKIQNNLITLKKEVGIFLIKRFGKNNIHTDITLIGDSRSKIDFYIKTNDIEFAVNVFYPNNKQTLIGTLNAKLKTNSTISVSHKTLIFLQGNTKIGDNTLANILARKKNKLNNNQYLMSISEFEKFCSNKIQKV